jgi:DNA helicase-2/ATP-dependent DNA helicase PcrA
MSKISLNPEQKKGVEYAGGPLLLVAGAGTGKTRVITERIKWLIQNKKAAPSEILALTFTEKAAAEMLERVDRAMPLGYEEPWLSTFHAFADRLLRDEGLEIGLDPAYKILTPPEVWLLIRENLFDFNLNYYRPLGNPTKFISAMLTLFSRAQDEDITPAEFVRWAKKSKKQKVKSKNGDEKEGIEKYSELANAYQTYQTLKIRESYLDFGDLILWTLKLFRERPAILKKYQSQFKHLLVDEFQDTNYAQYQLIKLLAPAKSRPNLLVSADDDQSIYKFRGAAVSNVLEFKSDYPKAATIVLTRNYRSGQKILDASYRLIQNNNPDRLEKKIGIEKKLVAKRTNYDFEPRVIHSITGQN